MANPYTIPSNVDWKFLSLVLFVQKLNGKRYDFVSYDPQTERPSAIIFIPDLNISEQAIFSDLLLIASSTNDFNALPNWATWTAADAETNINNSIFGGQTAVQVKANITSTLTDITTANVSQINARLAVIRTLFGNAVDAIIAIRGVLAAMGKALVYLRNMVIKLR